MTYRVDVGDYGNLCAVLTKHYSWLQTEIANRVEPTWSSLGNMNGNGWRVRSEMVKPKVTAINDMIFVSNLCTEITYQYYFEIDDEMLALQFQLML